MNSARTIPCVLVLPPRSKWPGFQSPRICAVNASMIAWRCASSSGWIRSSASAEPARPSRCRLIRNVVSVESGPRKSASNGGRKNGSKRRSSVEEEEHRRARSGRAASCPCRPAAARSRGRGSKAVVSARPCRVAAAASRAEHRITAVGVEIETSRARATPARRSSTPTSRSAASTSVITSRLSTIAPSATASPTTASSSPYIDASRTPRPEARRPRAPRRSRRQR